MLFIYVIIATYVCTDVLYTTYRVYMIKHSRGITVVDF